MSAHAATPPADPIDALLARHAETSRQCDALLQLSAAGPGTAPIESRAADLLAYFDGPAQAARRIQEHGLFPALIESMAGSDAVCLRGMTQGLRDERRRLDGIWRARLRPALARLAAGADPATTWDAATVQSWVEDFKQYLCMADEELLPMAARLLIDETWATPDESWPSDPPAAS